MEKKGLILIPFLTGYGGTETVINNLLDEYNKKKNEYNINLKVYSLGGYKHGNWLKYPNVKIFQFPKNRFIREFLYLFLLPFLIFYSIIKENPEFIISTNPIIWTIAKLCSQLLHRNIKIVAWYHYSYKLKPVNRFCLYKPDYFFVISKFGEKELSNLGISKSKIFVVYNPIKPTTKIIKPSKCHNKFIYVGRLEYRGQKNISELFKALSLLKDKSWNLNIYGVGPDKNKLTILSKELNIYRNIHWMGFVKNIFNHIDVSDSLLLTSTYEGFPMVLAEAVSHGMYVISSNCPTGPSEIINSYNGCLYKLGDIYSLAKDIRNVLEGNIHINQDKIRQSINYCYTDKYLLHFIKCINNIGCGYNE